MKKWRFLNTESDGHTWLRNSTELHTFIAFQDLKTESGEGWYRIMVVTAEWLAKEAAQLQAPNSRAIFAAMLVVTGSSPDEIVACIDSAVSLGGVFKFATRVAS